MKRILQLTAFFAALIATTSANAQFMMGGPGHPLTNPADCNTIAPTEAPNFMDNGASGNYTPYYNGTMTFCPNLSTGTKMSVFFATNNGFTFDIHPSDTLYIYDGATTAAPLLASLNNNTVAAQGMSFTASWANASGCLTFRFASDASNEGTGWDAMINCGNGPQPFEIHTEAFVNGDPTNRLNPLDTGFVDICLGDSILFVAKPLFPNSLEATGYGYSQNVNTNIAFSWNISDGNTYPANDSIWVVPTTRNGFLVELGVRDQFPQSFYQTSKIRVSQLPSFAGTGPLRPTMCLGEQTNLMGGTTPVDTVGINIPGGTFALGGAHAGLTYLPDGSGVNYTTTIPITGFPNGSTITDISDLNEVCLTMEHSFLGDLEVWLECPTGQTVPLINAYPTGSIPGGTSGGGNFLGHPLDNTSGTPGIGWEYCFSSAFNTAGPMHLPSYAANTIPVAASTNPPLSAGNSINPNVVYEPYSTFASLNGCPVNGDWTIYVRDNIGADDGYIFEWGLYFDASFFPGLSGYQNTADSTWWSSSSSIISGQNDTSIVIAPNTIGAHTYQFNIIDDFGCVYDTIVQIEVRPVPAIMGDTLICAPSLQVAGTQTFNGGVWSAIGDNANNVTFNSTTANNPVITFAAGGDYTIGFLDNTCANPLEIEVRYPTRPVIFNDTTICGPTYQVVDSTVRSYDGGVWSVLDPSMVTFSPSNTTAAPLITMAAIPYSLNVTYTDKYCPNLSDNATILFVPSGAAQMPEVACNLTTNALSSDSYQGGVWSVANNPQTNFNEADSATFVGGNTLANPPMNVTYPGVYTVSYTDNFCNITTTQNIYFPPFLFTEVNDTTICDGITYPLTAWQPPYGDVSYVWNTGSTNSYTDVTQPGTYIVTVSNACHSYTDTAVVSVIVCDIDAPNVISLSSKDGNNLWFVDSEGIAEFNCVIVNRWGNVVYEFNNVTGYWNGEDKAGNIVSEGVYFYTIKSKILGGNELTKQGFITVIH